MGLHTNAYELYRSRPMTKGDTLVIEVTYECTTAELGTFGNDGGWPGAPTYGEAIPGTWASTSYAVPSAERVVVDPTYRAGKAKIVTTYVGTRKWAAVV